jgi:hypothetical protein
MEDKDILLSVVSVALVTLLGAAIVYIWGQQGTILGRLDAVMGIITLTVLTGTLIAVIYYVKATTGIVEQEKEANTFATITRVHERMSNETSYRLRRYLNNHFIEAFNEAEDKFNGSGKPERDKVKTFNKLLSEYGIADPKLEGYTALDAAEMVFLDFDSIILPYWSNIRAAKELVRSYKPVLKKTAESLLPFMGKQLELRGKSDPEYNWPYFCMLKKSGISKEVRGYEDILTKYPKLKIIPDEPRQQKG